MDRELENLIEQGMFENVIKRLEPKGASLGPWDVYYYAQSLTNLGKYKEASNLIGNNETMSLDDCELSFRIDLLAIYLRYKVGLYSGLLEELTELLDLVPDEYYKAEVLDLIGLIYARTGDIDTSIEVFEKSLKYADMHPRKDIVGLIYNDYGIAHMYAGNYREASDFYELAITTLEPTGHEQYIGLAVGNLGKLYRIIGENERAIELATDSLAIKEAFGNQHDLSQELVNVGILHQILGEFSLAKINYEKALEIRKKIQHNEEISSILYHLTRLAVDTGNIEMIRAYKAEHDKLLQNSQTRTILQRNKVMGAILLSQSKDLSEKFMAKQLFADIIEEPIVKLDLTLFCLFSVIDLLLLEYKASESDKTLVRVFSYINQLNDLARQQRLFSMVVQVLIFQSRVYLLRLDLEKAQSLLVQSEMIIDEHGFETMVPQIKREQKKIRDLFEKFENIVNTNASVMDRVKESHVVEYLDQIKRSMIYNK